MQKQNLPLLSISRENYQVPKGEEQQVHYKAERLAHDPVTLERTSHPDLIKTNVKQFDEVKRNLELQGYTIEILHHPLGKYTDVRLPKDVKAQLREKDDEIAALRAQLNAMKADATAKEEAKPETAPESDEANAETAEEVNDANAENASNEKPATTSGRKGGRSKKSE